MTNNILKKEIQHIQYTRRRNNQNENDPVNEKNQYENPQHDKKTYSKF